MAASSTFDLSIDLGNAAMEDEHDVADALERTATKVRTGDQIGPIRDINGNTVGHFGFDSRQEAVREATDAENAFKVASFNAAKAVVDGSPVAAREWLEVAKHASQLDGLAGIRRLELEPGDTIVLETDARIPLEKIEQMQAHVKREVGDDVRVLIFAGASVAGVWQAAS